MTPAIKVVLDTNVVVSATLFRSGFLSPLRAAWQSGQISPIISEETNKELLRVLAYKKFKLTETEIAQLLAQYLPFTRLQKPKLTGGNPSVYPICRDKQDQMFLELAVDSRAHFLVSGDEDLLALAHHELVQNLDFKILSPAVFMQRLAGEVSQ